MKASIERPAESTARRSPVMSKEEKQLYRKLIRATMSLANCEHNLKVAQGYIGDYFSNSYVSRQYQQPLERARQRSDSLHRKLEKMPNPSRKGF